MKKLLEDLFVAVAPEIVPVLKQNPAGVKEYDLMSHLVGLGFDCFAKQPDKDQGLDLFHRHFLLFHCLYRLQDQLTEIAYLSVHCLNIQLLPLTDPTATKLTQFDGERDYYLDHEQLEQTTAEDVSHMLSGFWDRYTQHFDRSSALTILGLNDEASAAEIEMTYRRLAMRHHPDRGGDAERFCEIKHAWNMLKQA